MQKHVEIKPRQPKLVTLNLFLFVSILVYLLFYAPLTIAEPENLTIAKHNVSNYYDTGLYLEEVTSVINQAEKYILTRIQRNQHAVHPAKLAIVLDIDETSLSNYTFMKQQDFGYNPIRYHNHNLKADDEVIQPTLNLFNQAKSQGITVFFITGRPLSEAETTKINLHNAGYHSWKKIFFKPTNKHFKSVAEFKTAMHQKISNQGYTIIANIGDQLSDLQGNIAEKRFKLPNPWYFIP